MSNSGRPTARAAVFARVTASYWTGPHRLVACVLTAMLLGLVLSGVYVQSLINQWNAAFFDAIEKRASDAFSPLLWQFAEYVVIAGLIMMSTVLVRMMLMLRVREWVSTHVMTRWLATGAYLRLDRQAKGAETPEFRIADDVRNALDQFADLFVGFFTSVLLAITFSLVLAQVGGSISLPQLGITIPAYFLVAAVLYAFLMSGLASLVGWRLVGLIARKNHLEGVFRYELMCVRENAPAIATQHGERKQYQVLGQALTELIAGWWRVAVRHARVSGIASANAVLVGVFPVVIAMPKYLAGEMSLGAMMQLATAFVQVQMALNWIVDNFLRFAELSASANRVGEFITAIEHSNGQQTGAEPVVTSAPIAPELATKVAE